MKIGYVYASNHDRSLEMQMKALEKAGCERLVHEISPDGRLRPELQHVLNEIKPGDTIVVWKLDRLARSTRDLLEKMEQINKAGGEFQSLSEPWASTAAERVNVGVMTVFAGFAEFERNLVRSRIEAGREKALQRGMRPGRPRKLTPDQVRLASQLLAEGESIANVARMFNVHEATIYRLAATL